MSKSFQIFYNAACLVRCAVRPSRWARAKFFLGGLGRAFVGDRNSVEKVAK